MTLFEEIAEREKELAEMRKQASKDLEIQLEQILTRMDTYGVPLPQSLISRVSNMRPVVPPKAESGRKQPAKASKVFFKTAKPEGIPEEARFCRVCEGWTDHDTRSHRQEKPGIPRKLKYGQAEQSPTPRLVKPNGGDSVEA